MANPAAGCYDVGGAYLPCTWSIFDVLDKFVWTQARNPKASIPPDSPGTWVHPKRVVPINIPNPFDKYLDDPVDRVDTTYTPGYWKYAPAPFVHVTIANPQNSWVVGRARDTLLKPSCVDFYTRVLNSANVNTKKNPVLEGGDLSKIFEDFLNQKKGGLTRKPIPGGAGFGSTKGLIRPGKKDSNGTIYLPPGNGDWNDARKLVDEIFHLAGSKANYWDFELAVAVHNIPEFAEKNPLRPQSTVFDLAYTGDITDRYDGGYSSYFHNIERIYCEVSK